MLILIMIVVHYKLNYIMGVIFLLKRQLEQKYFIHFMQKKIGYTFIVVYKTFAL